MPHTNPAAEAPVAEFRQRSFLWDLREAHICQGRRQKPLLYSRTTLLALDFSEAPAKAHLELSRKASSLIWHESLKTLLFTDPMRCEKRTRPGRVTKSPVSLLHI